MEAISLKCPNCGAVLTVPDTYLGRTSKCGRCRHVVFIAPPSSAPHRASTVAGSDHDRRSADWLNVLVNVALSVLMLLLVGILVRYIFQGGFGIS